MSDNAWLAAYEAQKAAVIKKMSEKSSPASSSGSVSGTSKFSGLVDAKETNHVVKSNQVTKLMDNLKAKPITDQVRQGPKNKVQPERPKPHNSQAPVSSTRPLPGPSISSQFQGPIR